MQRGESKMVCVKLQPEDVEAIRLITDYLKTQLWFPHIASNSVAVRFSLRRAVATLATEIQSREKRRKTVLRRKSNQVRKDK